MTHCRYCGTKINPKKNFCSNCGVNRNLPFSIITYFFHTHSGQLLVSGIFIVIAVVIFLLFGLIETVYWWRYFDKFYTFYIYVILIIYLCSIFGIIAAINIFRKKSYEKSFNYILYFIIFGFVPIFYNDYLMIVLIFAILSIIFLIVGKKEFENVKKLSIKSKREK